MGSEIRKHQSTEYKMFHTLLFISEDFWLFDIFL
jgi:hypothetical protein